MASAWLATVMSLSQKLSGHSKLKKRKLYIYYGEFQLGTYVAFCSIFSARLDMLHSWVWLVIEVMMGYLQHVFLHRITLNTSRQSVGLPW